MDPFPNFGRQQDRLIGAGAYQQVPPSNYSVPQDVIINSGQAGLMPIQPQPVTFFPTSAGIQPNADPFTTLKEILVRGKTPAFSSYVLALHKPS
jgi:hypothetical protein